MQGARTPCPQVKANATVVEPRDRQRRRTSVTTHTEPHGWQACSSQRMDEKPKRSSCGLSGHTSVGLAIAQTVQSTFHLPVRQLERVESIGRKL
eukprot:scaffold121877_cov34-Tisochrysis_lutea.AAC.5